MSKNRECLRKVKDLIDDFEPDVLVVEKCEAAKARRCARVRRLNDAIATLAAARRIRIRRICRRQVQAPFEESGAANKHEIAVAIARRFPELEPQLPPKRKPWMAEHHAERMFGAVALGSAWCLPMR